MNILFTICARAGSKGVKNKNIKHFLGVPLVYYTLAAYFLYCEKYGQYFDSIDLAINTDSKELIGQIAQSKILYVYIERKDSLSGDIVSKMSVIKDTLSECEKIASKKYDVVIDLDLTSPLRKVEDVKGVFDALLNNRECDIVFTVTRARRNPYFNMVCLKNNGFYDRIIMSKVTSRQQAPVCYDMNASIYAYRRSYLCSDREMERKALLWEMEDTAVLDIDSEEDLKLMEVIAEYLFQQGGYEEIRRKAMTFIKEKGQYEKYF